MTKTALTKKGQESTRHLFFRRLRKIEQLGTLAQRSGRRGYSRHEHSLSVAKTAVRIGKKFSVSAHCLEALEVAALLHDVGHGIFSHAFDDLLRDRGIESSHETRSLQMVRFIGTDFKWPDDFIQAVQELIAGSKLPWRNKLVPFEFRFVINSPDTRVDADRLSYLPRDAAIFGVEGAICSRDVINFIEDSKIVNGRWECDASDMFWTLRSFMHEKYYSRLPPLTLPLTDLSFCRLRTRQDFAKFLSLTEDLC
jgi:putative nucleotidyltransferase with HDIG domain